MVTFKAAQRKDIISILCVHFFKRMDKLEFQPTPKTPYVLLDPMGKIKFKGRSIPEDVSLFYEDILDWIIAFASSVVIRPAFNSSLIFDFSVFSKVLIAWASTRFSSILEMFSDGSSSLTIFS